MAETPQEPPSATQKRPLEEPSSPSGPNDQPEAKRPALDKILQGDGADDEEATEPLEDPADETTEVAPAQEDAAKRLEDARKMAKDNPSKADVIMYRYLQC